MGEKPDPVGENSGSKYAGVHACYERMGEAIVVLNLFQGNPLVTHRVHGRKTPCGGGKKKSTACGGTSDLLCGQKGKRPSTSRDQKTYLFDGEARGRGNKLEETRKKRGLN